MPKKIRFFVRWGIVEAQPEFCKLRANFSSHHVTTAASPVI
jgi:hypothetical protein